MANSEEFEDHVQTVTVVSEEFETVRNVKVTFSERSQYTLAPSARSGPAFAGPLRFFRKTFFDQNFKLFLLK